MLTGHAKRRPIYNVVISNVPGPREHGRVGVRQDAVAEVEHVAGGRPACGDDPGIQAGDAVLFSFGFAERYTEEIYYDHPYLSIEAARYLADGSCPVGPDTCESAYWSAQSALGGANAILDGAREAYALCRPPGHHARAEAAGGFCYLNNAAIAAQALRAKFGRVAILDTDMHHGQGIQEIFYDRSDVLYVSIHGDPTNFYPAVAGFDDERGEA